LIAPDHQIINQDIWPVSSAQTFIDAFEDGGVEQASCSGINADFSSDITEICGSGSVSFSDNSTGTILSWNWTFEGGDPETSTEQNPVVSYSTAGNYDVTLTVNGVDGDTYTVENYISVFEIPDVTQEVFANACIFWDPYELIGGSPEGGTYSGPGVTDNMFDAEVAGLGTHTITYTYVSDNGCENYVEEQLFVDVCAGVDEYKNNVIRVYPNPASKVVNISSRSDINSVRIYNYTGQLMESSDVSNTDYLFNIEDYTSGIYSIIIETKKGIVSKKLIIQ